METIRVNMTPCEDVQTIHASQNDNEAREWGFELHNNGEKIDSSSISDQMVFKAYKGGTEQILPENGSTPTTSPFKGDIRYPQGLLSDQEFLYRESPTEEDGLAFIDNIKGNTLVWNQLVQNGNFADTSLWRTYSSTGFSVSNNVGSFTVTGSTGAIYQTNTPTYVSGHKYLVIADFYVSQQSNISVEVSGTRGRAVSVNANTWYRYSDIVAPSAQGNFSLTCGQASVQVRNVMCFDLTQMGLDITDPSEFTSLFPLPYYAYNQGTLLSFNGNGIKTVGKNLFGGVYNNLAFGNTVVQDPAFRGYTLNVSAFKGKQITVSRADTTSNNRFRASFFSVEPVNLTPFERELNYGNQYYSYDSQLSFTLTVPNGANYLLLYISNNETVAKDLMIEIGSVVSDYEPYASSTLSLPISQYFPNGMKSAGNVYDELTETKAITRIGMVDLGSLTWNYNSSSAYFTTNDISSLYKVPTSNLTVANIIDPKHTSISANDLVSGGQLGIAIRSNGTLMVKDTNYTDATAFKTAMSGVYLYYELATSTETSFTTASLVTENGEIPLSNEDDVLIGKCTEQLSANAGFIEGKIKLSDEDGDVYSNKIQIHVERSPQ